MITFKQFLGEAELLDAKEFFHRECKPFISQAQGAGVFFRGTVRKPPTLARVKLPSGREVNVCITTIRKDRRPMDMPHNIHYAVDEWMQEKFGIAGRSGSAFVVGGEQGMKDAASYGTLYAVIPQGDFKFLWSPNVKDLFDLYLHGAETIPIKEMPQDGRGAAMVTILEGKGYKTTDLPAAIASTKEVMVECEHLLLIKLSGEDEDGFGETGNAILTELKEILK